MAVLWAIDPTDQNTDVAWRVGKVASLWGKALGADVTPISVVSHRNLTWLSEKVPTPLSDILSQAAIRNIRGLVEKLEIKNVGEPRLLTQKGAIGSRRAEARVLVEEAARVNASAIVVATHGPKRLKQIRLGSFTEYLIATSKVPVVVVNPKTEPPETIKRILFPTDYSEDSQKVFQRLMETASQIDAQVTVFHVKDLAFQFFSTAGDWGASLDPILVSEAWSEEEQRKNTLIAEWKKIAEVHKVKCGFTSVSSIDGLSQTILDVEKSADVDMIAMTTYAGPVEQAILGSVARDVIYGATRPVLIVPVPHARKTYKLDHFIGDE